MKPIRVPQGDQAMGLKTAYFAPLALLALVSAASSATRARNAGRSIKRPENAIIVSE